MARNLEVVQSFSGGMDSATLLTYLHDRGDTVRALGFDYGQRHVKELEVAREFARGLGVSFEVVSLRGLTGLLDQSALTNPDIAVPEGHYEEESMKATVVPNRNMIMLSAAIGYAENSGFDAVAIANHAGDHAIYPDCRPEFVDAMDTAAQLGTYNHIRVLSPFRNLSKTAIAALGIDMGIDYDKTWSCYKGGTVQCGVCGTCTERLEALEGARDIDVARARDEVEAIIERMADGS